jgi:hypothetical protein
MDSQILTSPVWQTVAALITIITAAIGIIIFIQTRSISPSIKKVLSIVTVFLTVLLIAGTSEVIHVLSPTSQILPQSPTATSISTVASSPQPLPLHIDCITCNGPLSIGADLTKVTVNASRSPKTTFLTFSFYNTLNQPAAGLHFTSIQLMDSTTGIAYKGFDTNRWDMVGQQQVPQIVQFQFVIQRGKTYTLSMALADARGNPLPYLSKDLSLIGYGLKGRSISLQ